MPDQVLEHCPTENREPLRGLVASHIGLIAWRTVSECVLVNGNAIEDEVTAAYAKGQGSWSLGDVFEALLSPLFVISGVPVLSSSAGQNHWIV